MCIYFFDIVFWKYIANKAQSDRSGTPRLPADGAGRKIYKAQTIKGNQTGEELPSLSGSLVAYQCGKAVVAVIK